MIKRLLVAALALALIVPVAACSSGGGGGTIKLGVVLSTSGLLGPMGQDMMKAAELAVKEINDGGGLLGKKVELVEEDDTTDAATALTRVKKIVEVDGVQLMVAGMTSGGAMAIGPYLAQKGVLAVSPSATSPNLQNQPWKEWLFRSTPDDAFQGAVLADFVKEKGYSKLATMVQDNPYGVGLEKALVDSLKAKGWTGKQVVSVHYDPTKKDYRTELDQIKSASPDVVLAVTYAEDGIIVFKQASEMGLGNIAWLGCDGNYGDGMFAEPKAADFMAASMVAGTRAAGPSGATYTKFATAYKTFAGKDASVYTDTVYDAIKLLAASVKAAGKTDPAAVKAEMLKIGKNYDGASGTITFNTTGDRVSGTFELWKVVKDSTATTGYKNTQIKTVTMK